MVALLAPAKETPTWASVLEARFIGWVWVRESSEAQANCITCNGVATIRFAGSHPWSECANCGQRDIITDAIERGWLHASDIERLL